jgi:hypothetical protein
MEADYLSLTAATDEERLMVADNSNDRTQFHLLDGEMAELSLLVPTWQAEALEQAAQAEGITVAQYLRRILNKNLAQLSLSQPGYYYG